jgi:hypothetical protein
MQLARALLALSLVTRAAAAQTASTAPPYPAPVLASDEHALKGVFPSRAHWVSSTGTPVTVQALEKNGKIVLRGYVAGQQQDLATSAFPDAELAVFDHEDGKTFGMQLHQYIGGAPDKYEGWNVQLVGQRLKVVRTTRFNGKQPQPQWLIDTIVIKNWKSLRRAVQVLRWAAYDDDNNAWSKYVDDEPVRVTWRDQGQTRDETMSGTALLTKLRSEFPLVGHNVTCKALCCTATGKELGPWTHITNVCFDAEPKPEEPLEFAHIRSIEIVKPVLPN